MVLKYPGLANPEISKIIGDQWQKTDDETKNYWKRLAEEEKTRHQRQYPQYKYQPRRGGKNGPAARAAAAAGAGEDQGRCPKCGGRHISTPRTPSTPFGGIPGQGHGFGPLSASPAAAMQPFITNDPRVVEQVQHQPLYRNSTNPQYGSMDDARRQQHSYYPHEPLRQIEEDYEAGVPHGMSRRRGPQQDDYDMLSSPDIKRRRFDPYAERGSPMSAVPQHRGQHQQQQQQYPMGGQSPYPYPMQQQPQPQYAVARRSSSVSAGDSVYSNQPSSAGGGNYPTAPLPHPRAHVEPQPQQVSQQQQQQQQEHIQQQPQQQQQGRDMGMAPPPRPSRLSTTSAVPPPPPGLPAPHTPHPTRGLNYDENFTLPPLKIPNSPPHVSSMTDSARSLSSSGPSGGLGMDAQQQQQMLVQHGDSQARGIEAMVMSIPFVNKLDVLRKISPALSPPGVGSPGVATRGPVIAIEGGHVALMRAVRPVIERALRASGECDVRVWTDSSVDRGVAGEVDAMQKKKSVGRHGGEDVEMTDIRDKLSVNSGSRHGSISSGSRDGSKTPTPRQPGLGGMVTAAGTSTLDYLQTIMEWHTKSAEIVKHVTTTPKPSSVVAEAGAAAAANITTTPVAFIPGGFSLTLSDRFASTVAITDPYSPVDHWQWMATLWRGIVGPDLVVYVRPMTAEEAARNSGTVEYRAPGVMVVRVVAGAGENNNVDEKTERRLAFEVMEWVRAGSFREGYSFGGEAS